MFVKLASSNFARVNQLSAMLVMTWIFSTSVCPTYFTSVWIFFAPTRWSNRHTTAILHIQVWSRFRHIQELEDLEHGLQSPIYSFQPLSQRCLFYSLFWITCNSLYTSLPPSLRWSPLIIRLWKRLSPKRANVKPCCPQIWRSELFVVIFSSAWTIAAYDWLQCIFTSIGGKCVCKGAEQRPRISIPTAIWGKRHPMKSLHLTQHQPGFCLGAGFNNLLLFWWLIYLLRILSLLPKSGNPITIFQISSPGPCQGFATLSRPNC